MSETLTRGECLCGAVRFEISGEIGPMVHCHCLMCRKAHGAGYVTWLVVPRERFRVVEGERVLERYRSSAGGSRHFCRTCGSSMLCDLDAEPGTIDVAAGCVVDPIEAKPALHIFFDDRAHWVEAEDGLPRVGGTDGMSPLDSKGGEKD